MEELKERTKSLAEPFMDKSAKCVPMISVIIPIKDEERFIERCLRQLVEQTYPLDKIEILAVDGMSKDRTREIIEKFGLKKAMVESPHSEMPIIRVVDNPQGQRASAMNIGIKEASGDFIVRVDGRSIIPPDYIVKCISTSIDTGADNVGGMQVPLVFNNGDPRKECTQRAIGIALSHPFGVGNARFRLGVKSGYVDTVYLGCFRREVFQKVGLFDEHAPVISEDSDLNYRIRKAGGKVYFNKDIVAYYYPRDSIRDLARLYFRYGGAKAGNLLKTKNLTAWRQWVPPIFFATVVLLTIISFFYLRLAYLLMAIFGAYLLVDFSVSAYLSVKKGQLRLFPRLLVIFPTLHFSWAIGFYRRLLQRPKPGEYWRY